MSITFLGDDKDTERTLVVDEKGLGTVTRGYLFSTSTVTSEFAIYAHASCPKRGNTHPEDPTFFVKTVTISNYAPFAGWKAVVTYSNEREIRDNPLDEPARISWDGEEFQKPAVKDKNGDAILNSAGDPYDPPVMVDDTRIAATITKNVASVPEWWLSYKDAVNSDAFVLDGLPIPEGVAKLKRQSISEMQTQNDVDYYTVTLVMHFNEDGWKATPLDAGFRRIYSGTSRELITLENEDGEKEYPPAPVPLDGSGVELADPTPDTAIYREHEVYNKKPFSVLPIV